ncbi:MAG: hypothetical protein KJ587_15550 [Alphaproteobacteria bacterium]|nr:hypothetical protein [Alphaproteobacteria bacterium]
MRRPDAEVLREFLKDRVDAFIDERDPGDLPISRSPKSMLNNETCSILNFVSFLLADTNEFFENVAGKCLLQTDFFPDELDLVDPIVGENKGRFTIDGTRSEAVSVGRKLLLDKETNSYDYTQLERLAIRECITRFFMYLASIRSSHAVTLLRLLENLALLEAPELKKADIERAKRVNKETRIWLSQCSILAFIEYRSARRKTSKQQVVDQLHAVSGISMETMEKWVERSSDPLTLPLQRSSI